MYVINNNSIPKNHATEYLWYVHVTKAQDV